MKQDVVASAEAMSNDIDATGHVSIYGIYFDTGKSEIKPESDAAISAVAQGTRAPQSSRFKILLLEQGEWNDISEDHAQIIAICEGCYNEIWERNVKD